MRGTWHIRRYGSLFLLVPDEQAHAHQIMMVVEDPLLFQKLKLQ